MILSNKKLITEIITENKRIELLKQNIHFNTNNPKWH